MTQTAFRIGEYRVEMRRDRASGGFVGAVVNKRYPVRLHAESRPALRRKFERVLVGWLGAQRGRRAR